MYWNSLDNECLTPHTKQLLTAAQASGLDWEHASHAAAKSALKEDLFRAQLSRCAYCRREIRDEVGLHEIDHILPKKQSKQISNASSNRHKHRRQTHGYPQHRFFHTNLVLTCKRCNNKKGTYDSRIDRTIPSGAQYPHPGTEFAWVHPYLHNYQDHIEIRDGLIYTAVDMSDEGRAVISACRLDTLEAVELLADEVAVHARNGLSPLIMKLWSYSPPLSDGQISEIVSIHFPEIQQDYVIDALERYPARDFLAGARIIDILTAMS